MYSSFVDDVVREMRERHVSHPRYVGKAWFCFCFRHWQRLLRFEGDGRAGPAGPVHFTATACQSCRVVKMRRYDFIGSNLQVFLVPQMGFLRGLKN